LLSWLIKGFRNPAADGPGGGGTALVTESGERVDLGGTEAFVRSRVVVRIGVATTPTGSGYVPGSITCSTRVSVRAVNQKTKRVMERAFGPANGLGRSLNGEPYEQSAESRALEYLEEPLMAFIRESVRSSDRRKSLEGP